MPPGGPRSRRPEGGVQTHSPAGARVPSGSSVRGTVVDRDDAFKSIFGRTAAGHHMGGASGGAGLNGAIYPQGYPTYPAGAPRTAALPSSQGGIYDAFAPPLPPPAPLDPYAAGPSNYAVYSGNPAPQMQMRPQQSGRSAVVGGPREPRPLARDYAHDTGSAYSLPATQTNYSPQIPDGPDLRRGSFTPSLSPSVTPSTFSSSTSPYPANVYAPYATQSQPALQQYQPTPRSVSATGNGPVAYADRRRMDSGGPIYPTTLGTINRTVPVDSYERRGNGGDDASIAHGLTPAQAYQAAEGYGRRTVSSSSVSPAPVISRSVSTGTGNGTLRTTQRIVSSRSQQPSRGRIGEVDEVDVSPPPTYSSHDAYGEVNGQRQNTSTPPQLPDIVSYATDLSFLDDLEGLGLGPSGKYAKKEISRTADVEDRNRLPSNSHSSGSLTSQRHYEDEMRDQVTPVTNRQDVYMNRTGHRRQYSDSSVVSTSTVQSNMTQSRQFNGTLPYVDTSANVREERHSAGASSPAATIAEGFGAAAQRRLSARTSSDSVRSMPQVGPPGARSSFGSGDVRAGSFSGTGGARDDAVLVVRSGSVSRSRSFARPPIPALPPSAYNFPSPTGSGNNISLKSKRPSALRKAPTIYPAFLSRVAEVFRQLIPLGDRVKDGLTYKDSFDGRDAVDLIAEIIRTSDRNLALLLGRALDAQRFFHDVTYDHRLRDSSVEIYRFRERLPSPFVPGEDGLDLNGVHSDRPSIRPTIKGFPSGSLSMTATSTHSNADSAAPTPATSTTTVNLTSEASGKSRRDSTSSTEDALPVGVFTLLTDCYSPTCSVNSLCYSINCPRRLEQQKRNNMKIQPGLTRKLSEESLVEVKETGTLWIHTVSKEIADSVDEKEQRRQEAINELIYTERDFVRDMEYLRDSWVKPLRTSDVVPVAKREDFVTQVFWNVHEILAVNQLLAEKLTKRQKHEAIVTQVHDILLDYVPLFEPFVTYGAHQLFGKYEFEKEKGSNPAFQRFVDETERDPASRKLELNGYLTKPTTRLARYPLLLEVILKHTPDDHPDKKHLPEAVKQIRAFLTRVNTESGKSENMFNLAQLDQQLIFRPGENIDLHLRDKNRELVYKGPLKCRGGTQSENADLLVFLFDHALLLVKPKWVNKHEQYKVYRKPIPLELLVVSSPDDIHNASRMSSSVKGKPIQKSASAKSAKELVPKPESKHGYSLTLLHLGRKGYTMTLWAPTFAGRRKWLEHIDVQQQSLRDRSRIFETIAITNHFFGGANKLNCAAPYDGGRRMIYGTENGVYFSNLHDERFKQPTIVLALHDVTQVDVLEDFQLLVVLAERSVTTYPLEALDPTDPTAALKRGKHLSSHTSFFKSGICLGRTLLCIVKSSSLSSTIKTLEPVDLSVRGKKQPTPFRRLLNNSNEPFKVFKEFYIPTESSGLSFLKTKLCVATTRGFEVVDLETLDTQGLLDPSDSSLDFVSKRENVRPIAIYRVEENFLLCYAEFAFYVNKTGWRARPKWGIQWEGYPTSFGLHYPYVLAFEPSFVEVRHVETGNLVQIISGTGIRCLFAETPPSTVNAPAAMPMYRPGMPVPLQNPYGTTQQPPYGYNQGATQQPPYGMGPPRHRMNVRSQIIFVSDNGHVQVLKVLSPLTNRDSSGSGSVSRR